MGGRRNQTMRSRRCDFQNVKPRQSVSEVRTKTSAVSNDERLPQGREDEMARGDSAQRKKHRDPYRRRHRPRNQRFRTALSRNLALLPQSSVTRLHSPGENRTQD